jgi:predicted Zn-dependent protease
MIQLALQGEGSDPRAAAQRALAKAGDTIVRQGPSSVGELSAYQARLSQADQQGRVGGLFTWIASGGRVYRFECVAAEARFEGFEPACLRTVSSFRRLTQGERDAIRVRILHIAFANAGETPLALAARTGSAWSGERVAIANGLEPNARLERGRPVKIAVSAPYRPKR